MNRSDRRMRQAIATIVGLSLAKAQAYVHRWGFGEPVWVSADGTVTPYTQLGDRHLLNILHLKGRARETDSEQYRRLRDEASRRGLRVRR